jgi:hypothetical protein
MRRLHEAEMKCAAFPGGTAIHLIAARRGVNSAIVIAGISAFDRSIDAPCA